MLDILVILLFVVIIFIIPYRRNKTKKYSKYESNGSDIVQRFINNKTNKEPYKPVFDFSEDDKNVTNSVSSSNPFRQTDKEFVKGYNELATMLGFEPTNMNVLEYLTVDTTLYAFSKENDDPLGFNEACMVDTIIFTTYCIGSIIFKLANNKHQSTQFLEEYQNNMLKCVLKWCEIDESHLKRVWYSRFTYYNEQCKNMENIIEAFQDILMHDKYDESIDIYTVNTPIMITDFAEMVMSKTIITAYYLSILEMFEHSIKAVVNTL